MKYYHPNIVHQLKPTDIAKKRECSQIILDQIKESYNFVRLVLFSNETGFHTKKKKKHFFLDWGQIY